MNSLIITCARLGQVKAKRKVRQKGYNSFMARLEAVEDHFYKTA
jgi:hypothetical protein